ncbi:MAG TPA: ATP-binding cassette domain-containing protein, partial [Ktedonobacteraceae bacterium]|nr:ATP-binding cassette domain-containing protein [Ktedonobacteraceae bacterium]
MQKHIQLLQSKSSPPPAIEIHNLRKTYTGRGKNLITAVEHIDLSIPQGQVFGFLGTNGAGKTTTIKMTCGLVTPTTGTIRLNGYDVIRQRKQAMQQIGAVLEGTR